MPREISPAVGEVATRHPLCIPRDTTVLEASKLMRIGQVGELVVVEEPQGPLMPIGVVSARDIVTRVLALGLDPAVFTAGDIAWSAGPRAKVTDSLSHTLHLLEKSRTDTLPVIADDGSVAGVIFLNDVLLALGKI